MLFVERLADARLAELLAPEGPRLVTVHGLGGAGASTSVRRALGRRTAWRVDLAGATTAAEIRAKLGRAPKGTLAFVDELHRPAAARSAVEALGARGDTRVVVAARGPLGLPDEHRVVLGGFDPVATERLLVAELGRLGVRLPADAERRAASGSTLATLAAWTGGWLPAIRALALSIRVVGLSAVLAEAEPVLDDAYTAILEEALALVPPSARRLASALAWGRAPLDADMLPDRLARRRAEIVAGLAALVDRGLVASDGALVAMPAPVAACVRARATPTAAKRARGQHAAWVLAAAERERARHRRDPIGAGAGLERLRPELVALAVDPDPRTAVAATTCLEPLLFGRLARPEVLGLFGRALVAARAVGPRAVADVTLALVRTHLARGDHETAELLLATTPALDGAPVTVAYRTIYRGHVAAWRGALADATTLLDAAGRVLDAAPGEDAREEEAREDLLLQRVFVAHQAGDVDATERLARRCVAVADDRPSPRLGAVARRFVAEVALARGAAAAAVPLLRTSKDDLTRFGDHVGALFLSSRLVAALRAAGDEAGAKEEARVARGLAARAGENALELAVIDALDRGDVSTQRVTDLAWRVQIPIVRERSERWLAAQPASGGATLRLDVSARTASMAGRRLALARRATLWRLLVALVDAHRADGPRSSADLFAAAWPGDRVEPASQKKRVQTAVWTLRRELLGDQLETRPTGYALASELRIVE